MWMQHNWSLETSMPTQDNAFRNNGQLSINVNIQKMLRKMLLLQTQTPKKLHVNREASTWVFSHLSFWLSHNWVNTGCSHIHYSNTCQIHKNTETIMRWFKHVPEIWTTSWWMAKKLSCSRQFLYKTKLECWIKQFNKQWTLILSFSSISLTSRQDLASLKDCSLTKFILWLSSCSCSRNSLSVTGVSRIILQIFKVINNRK